MSDSGPSQQKSDKLDYQKEQREHIKQLIKEEQNLANEYSKMLFKYSGGALALSVTILGGLFEDITYQNIWFLYISWSSFVLCIVTNLLSLKAGQKAYEKDAELMTEEMNKTGIAGNESYQGIYVTISESCEWLSGLLFISGIAFFLAFIITNLE